MTYIIVTGQNMIVGHPFATFDLAYAEARRRFGDTVGHWLDLNLRIEERRPATFH